LLDDIAVPDVKKFQDGLLNFVEEKHKDIIDTIDKEKKLDDATEEKLKAVIAEYKGLFQA